MASGVGRLTQTITVIDKSNKVVGASKHIKDVFYEAKGAYLERRSEIKAERKRKEEKELQKAIETMKIADREERQSDVSRSRTHRSSHTHEPGRNRRHEYDERSQVSGSETPRSSRHSPSPRHPGSPRDHSPRTAQSPIGLAQFNEELYGQSRSNPTSPVDTPPNQLIRRARTDLDLANRPQLQRSFTAPDVDLDMAYGEYHDADLRSLTNVPQLREPIPPQAQQKELSMLVQKCQGLLDEANCAQHSVRTIFTHLQKNPEAMAGVALTLAEISNVASKMAPGALSIFSKSAPGVMALLISPEFLIAVGVGIGVTVVMFGGYKIVKKIKAARSGSNSEENLAATANATGQIRQPTGGSMDEALDVRELDRIEKWRRGIADIQGGQRLMIEDDRRTEISSYSAATSVEGEFITPYAAQSMGHLPLPDKKHKKKDRKEKKPSSSSRRQKEGNDDDRSSVSAASEASSVRSFKDNRAHAVKVKKPSPLRRMFASNSSTRS